MSRRTRVLGLLLATAGLGLAACQPGVGTAAYVGTTRITDEQVQADLNSDLADPDISKYETQQAGGDLSGLRRELLSDRIVDEIVTEGAAQANVTVSDQAVNDLVAAQGGYEQIRTAAHLTHDRAFRLVHDYLLATELGYTKKNVKRPTDESLRALYDQVAPQQTSWALGRIQAINQQQLDQAAALLGNDPAKYDSVAAKYPNPSTVPQATAFTANSVPSDLLPLLAKAKANDIIKYVGTGQAAGNFFLLKVYSITKPSFEKLKPTLSQQSLTEAHDAGMAYLQPLAASLNIRISPRYGQWDQKNLQIADTTNPVVQIGKPTPSASATPLTGDQ